MRVGNFFRSHSNSFDLTQQDRKKAVRSLSAAPRPALESRTPSTGSVRSADSPSHSNSMDENRKSVALPSPRSSTRSIPHVPATLSIAMESPPAVFYGTTTSSTGALLSGQLQLHVADEKIVIDSMVLKLTIDSKMKKPFHAHCPDCAQQSTELKKWSFLHGQATWKKGDSDFPFSYILPGHLPATMHGTLSSIEYTFQAIITTAAGTTITASKELVVKRAITPSEEPRRSVRIFPPTNLTANVELPSVIHPIGESSLLFRLDGVIKRNTENQTQTHWKLKRLTWRLDETQKVISPACAKHALKAGAAPTERKGLLHTDVKTLNSDELKAGWKCDYSSPHDGSIEMEFPFSIRADARPLCDMKAEDGTEVSHVLVIEMIVAEEFAPIKKPSAATPTGAARVLRMHFNTTVTERGGMGISWDEEQPPLYDDVPASPPGYGRGTADVVALPVPEYEI